MAVHLQQAIARGRPHVLQAHTVSRRGSYRLRQGLAGGLLLSGMLLGMACGVTDDAGLPPDVQDPETIQTPSGATARYGGAVVMMGSVMAGVMTASGIITDELTGTPLPLGGVGHYTRADSRQDLSVLGAQVRRIHQFRAQAREARGFLNAYPPQNAPVMRGHLYALEGYANIFLADLFCSGIPLSTVDFDGNYTLASGSSTEEVYDSAIALFDSAIAAAGNNGKVRFNATPRDSALVRDIAATGKGRALLALGRYAEAEAAVAAVPDIFIYPIELNFTGGGGSSGFQDSTALLHYWLSPEAPGAITMGNQEGQNGLSYLNGDPRTVADTTNNGVVLLRRLLPSGTPARIPLQIASGVEARLIEAEAALQADDDSGVWIEILNHLRQEAWSLIEPAPAGPLDILADPGTDGPGIDPLRTELLFSERAFWLYLTGHRQGDLRRLVRNYGRMPNDVFPTGIYPGGSGSYGNEVVIPMPDEEFLLNPKYTGCFHRNA